MSDAPASTPAPSGSQFVAKHPGDYPLIDADPHFSRVVRYMRPSDYATWAALGAATPAALAAWQTMDPVPVRNLRPALKVAAFLGLSAGFLLAYQRSTQRFWGWRENAPEVARDIEELSQRAREGKPLYGESEISPYLQGVAHRNSAFSQLKFSAIPWFNFVNHPNHGVDTSKYYESAKAESS